MRAFIALDIPPALREDVAALAPVSYTHLEGYKRQVPSATLERKAMGNARPTPSAKALKSRFCHRDFWHTVDWGGYGKKHEWRR